jgi:hypothetical protein
MKNLKLAVIALCIVSMLSGCVLFSKGTNKGNTSKKGNSVTGGQK